MAKEMEKEYVEKELSKLMERTFELEDEINSFSEF